jgi:HprK-related kinase A
VPSLVRESSTRDINRALRTTGLGCSIGPFSLHLKSAAPGFAQMMALMYADIPVEYEPENHFNDFWIELKRPHGWRRHVGSQVYLEADSQTPLEPFPLDHSFPYFEWGLNWLIATKAQQYLMFHSAVLERHGRALIMPAIPGSGKSTLCTALMLRGWRLLSDEFGLYRPDTGLLDPLPRPIPLKNESIAIIRQFSPEAVMGPVYTKTRKGNVAHVRPTTASITAAGDAVAPAWVVFPQYLADATELLHPFAKGRAFLRLSGNSFNYRLQGARGFNAVADVVERCETWYLEFSDLDKAIALLEEMTDQSVA